MPKPVKKALHSEFGRFYNFLTASREDIINVSGMGPERYESIQSANTQEITSGLGREFPEHGVFARCPECTTEWLQPIISTDTSFTAVQHEVYCPECMQEQIPETYLAGPVAFTPNPPG